MAAYAAYHDRLMQEPWVARWLKQLGRSVEEVVDLKIMVHLRPKYECEEGWSPHWKTYAPTGFYDVYLTFSDGSSERGYFTKQDFRIARRLAEKQRKEKAG